MKSIVESFKDTIGLSGMINESQNESRVDEGLKDIWNSLKEKFKLVYQYLKGLVVKAGAYFLPVDEDGEIMEAISPLTAGSAYKEGYINKSNTLVVLDKNGAKIAGGGKFDEYKRLYGSGNSIKYWEKFINECEEAGIANVNEVKLQAEDPEAKYSRITDDKELVEEILMHIENPKLAKLLIWGAPGIGKTAIVNEVINAMKKKNSKYSFIMKTLSNETPDNFVLPAYEYDKNDEHKLSPKAAIDIPKSWLPVYKPTGDVKKDAKLDEKCGEGLLFIDELSRATPQVLNVILPLVNEGVFNGYKLGSGWTIVCASNRAEDEMSGQTNIGNALGNRFDQVFYEPTVHSWKKWAEQQNFISPLLLQWLSLPESENMSGGKFFYMDPNEELDNGVTTLMCTPRSWTNAMRKLAVYAKTGSLEGFSIFDIPTRIIARTLNTEVPATAVDSFLAFLEVVSKIGNFDQIVHDVWSGGSFKIDKKNLIKVALPLAQLIVTAHAKKLPTEEEFNNLCNWLVSQNSDQLAASVLDVYKNVFMGMLDDNLKNGAMVLKQKIVRSQSDTSLVGAYNDAYASFFKKWKINAETMPDYVPGLMILSKKYQGAFKEMVIFGNEAFG